MTLPRTPLEWAHLKGSYKALANKKGGTKDLIVEIAIQTHVNGCRLNKHLGDCSKDRKKIMDHIDDDTVHVCNDGHHCPPPPPGQQQDEQPTGTVEVKTRLTLKEATTLIVSIILILTGVGIFGGAF